MLRAVMLLTAMCIQTLLYASGTVHQVTQKMYAVNDGVCCPPELNLGCNAMTWSSVGVIKNVSPYTTLNGVRLRNALYLPNGYPKPDTIYITKVTVEGEVPLYVNGSAPITFNQLPNANVKQAAYRYNRFFNPLQLDTLQHKWIGFETQVPFTMLPNDSVTYRLVYVWKNLPSAVCRYITGYQWNGDNTLNQLTLQGSVTTQFTAPELLICKHNAKCTNPGYIGAVRPCTYTYPPVFPPFAPGQYYVLLGGVNSPDTNHVDGNYFNLSAGSYTLNFVDSNTSSILKTISFLINQDPDTINHYIDTACNFYTWINGVTYVNSGIYTYITGTPGVTCLTANYLNLTILPNTSTVQTETALNSYLWPITGLTYTVSGVYTATSLNANGCVHTDILNLVIYDGSFSLSLMQDQSVSCYGRQDASLSSSTGVAGSYNFMLDGGMSSNQSGFFTNLSPGTHWVCATQNFAPFETVCGTVTLTEPSPIQIELTVDTLVTCPGNNGSISASISGGVNILQPYYTRWYNASNTLLNPFPDHYDLSVSNLSAGAYYLVVEDDHLCFDTAFITLSQVNTGDSIVTYATECLPYTWNGNAYSLAGTYTFTQLNSTGCTDTYVLNLQAAPAASCPCSSNASFNSGEDIFNLNLNGNNTDSNYSFINGCVNPGPGSGSIINQYSNFKTLGTFTTLTAGSVATFTLSVDECDGSPYGSFGTGIWIDYDQNGSFTDTGELVFVESNIAAAPRIVSGSFVVPLTAASGNANLRVVVANGLTGATLSPCGTYSYGETEDYKVEIVPPPVGSSLNLKCFIQGYWNNVNAMLPVLFNQGQVSGALACDSLDISLREAFFPYNIVASCRTVVQQDGNASCNFPALSGSYYIVADHRNAVQTWSALPQSFGAYTTTYDFSTAASQAYGSNMIELTPGVWGFFSGDVMKDPAEAVDLLDLSSVDTEIGNFSFGYYAEDLNGDGNVDILDLPSIESNINNFIYSVHP